MDSRRLNMELKTKQKLLNSPTKLEAFKHLIAFDYIATPVEYPYRWLDFAKVNGALYIADDISVGELNKRLFIAGIEFWEDNFECLKRVSRFVEYTEYIRDNIEVHNE